MTVFELCGSDKWSEDNFFQIGKSKILWETAEYKDGPDKVLISRIAEEGGKPWLMGLNYKSRYISPNTEITLVPKQ
jgi:hypothetical protein